MRSVRALLVVVLALVSLLLTTGAGRVQAAAGDLFISEYVEGTSFNKALEIFNPSGASVDLAAEGYSVQVFSNGSTTASLTVNLSGVVAPGDVHVVTHPAADAAVPFDQRAGVTWNGNDAVALRKGLTVVDVIGQVGVDPGTEWGTALTSTADNTLRRN
jgi:uncharacterized protein